MKGMADLRGLRDIRSVPSTGRRSIPRIQSSAYLDLYVLQREKERLEKEAALLAKRHQVIRKRLSEIARQVEGLERSAQSECPGNGRRKAAEPHEPTKKQWKTFALKY